MTLTGDDTCSTDVSLAPLRGPLDGEQTATRSREREHMGPRWRYRRGRSDSDLVGYRPPRTAHHRRIIADVDLDPLVALVVDVHAWQVECNLIDHTTDDQLSGPTSTNDIGRT